MVYRIARAFEFLVITRIGIDELKITKKPLVWPLQKCRVIDVTPMNYTFEVNAMSAEKLPFLLPAVFTIGPCVDDHERLVKYAKLLSHHERDSHDVKDLAQDFKKEANIKQLVDVQGHEYFSYLGQKTQMEAANQAKIDVVEAKMKGEIGAKEQEGLIRQNAAKIDAETKIISTQRDGERKKEEVKVKTNVMIYENQREAELAEVNSILATKKAGWSQQAKMAEIEAQKTSARGQFSVVQETEGSRSRAYANQKAAEAKKLAAEAQTYAVQQAADAALYAKKKKAERLKGIIEAKRFYVHSLMSVLGGNYHALRDYMIIDKGLFKNMAKCNAEAIKGLQPKISIWTNGGTSGQMADGTSSGPAGIKELASIYKALPPLFEIVHEQTGMLPPSWMGSLAVFAADPATSNRRSA
ncbi:hypothetical protein P3S68_020551 [Capsicum galapagoense]